MENIKINYVDKKGEVIRCCVCRKQIVYPEKWYQIEKHVDKYYCEECYKELVKSLLQISEKKYLDG